MRVDFTVEIICFPLYPGASTLGIANQRVNRWLTSVVPLNATGK